MKLIILLSTLFLFTVTSAADAAPRVFKYQDGKIRAVANYLKNQRHGIETWYYRSGERKSRVNYAYGMKQGIKTIYNKDGTVKAKKLYKNNHLQPLPTVYSESRDSACYAKFPASSNEAPEFLKCTGALDIIFASQNKHPNTITALHLIKDIFVTAK